MAGRADISNKQIVEEPHRRAPVSTTELPKVTIDLSNHDLSAGDLLPQARRHPLRVVAPDGESYTVARLVVSQFVAEPAFSAA